MFNLFYVLFILCGLFSAFVVDREVKKLVQFIRTKCSRNVLFFGIFFLPVAFLFGLVFPFVVDRKVKKARAVYKKKAIHI